MATNKDFIVKNGLSVGGDVAITGNVTSDLHLNDNAKIKVGTATDGDLQIYHNVNNSFIEDVGNGALYIRAAAAVRNILILPRIRMLTEVAVIISSNPSSFIMPPLL